MELTTTTEAGVTIVYGLAPEGTAWIDLQAPGQTGTLDVYDVEGWQRKVVAADLDAALQSGPDAGAVDALTVVAFDAEGNELGRTQISPGREPIPPDGTSSSEGIAVEECTAFADGTTECS